MPRNLKIAVRGWIASTFLLVYAMVGIAPAQASEWDERWSHVEYIENCRSLAADGLQFHDCVIFMGEITLNRYLLAARGNVRFAERGMLDTEQFQELLQLSEAELPEQDLVDNAFRNTGLGMLWNYLSLPIQIEYQDMLNERRLQLARQERDNATTAERRNAAHQLVEESLAKRERLREAVDFFHDWRQQVAGPFWAEVHPDHRGEVRLSFEQ